MLKVINCYQRVNFLTRSICFSKFLLDEEKKPKRKVSETVELINLVDQNGKILGIKPKPESEKLAKKLNLILERVTDPKYGTMYPAYKMFSTSDLLKVEKRATTAKVLKKLPLNSRITEHDLEIKLHTIKKWIAKNCEVHVTIIGKNEIPANVKTLYKKIEEKLKSDCRILDVREKEEALKFIVIPPKLLKKENIKEKNTIKDPIEES